MSTLNAAVVVLAKAMAHYLSTIVRINGSICEIPSQTGLHCENCDG